jgi:DNA-binding IscR family transcriptional regulator
MFFYGKCDDCKDEETCSLRTVLEKWRDANLAVLDQTTLNDLLQQGTGEHLLAVES